MTTPRYKLVDPRIPGCYHLVTRCVRGAWLFGKDPDTGKDYSHRKKWLLDRLFLLAQYFAIEVHAYSVLSNHFHLVVYLHPTIVQQWSNEEVADRWVEAFPPRIKGMIRQDLKPLLRRQLLKDKVLLADRRKKLGCLSTFMKHLKQPLARRANQEDGRKGHFFEGRFYSGALLTKKALIDCMAYVDLNPIRARLARKLRQCLHTSVLARLQSLRGSRGNLKKVLGPLVSGLGKASFQVLITLAEYIQYLETILALEINPRTAKKPPHPWFTQAAAFKRRRYAYGSEKAMQQWNASRGFKRLGAPLPV